jgi:hypothetical protein
MRWIKASPRRVPTAKLTKRKVKVEIFLNREMIKNIKKIEKRLMVKTDKMAKIWGDIMDDYSKVR